MSFKELARRVAVAVVGIPLALFLIYLGGWPLTLFLVVIAGLGAQEFFALTRAKGIRALETPGILASVGLVLLAGAHPTFETAAPASLALVVALFLLAGVGAIWLRWPDGSPLLAVPLTLAGAIYTGGTLSFALFLRHLPDSSSSLPGDGALFGPLLLVFPLAITWAGDSAAYFFGHAWGKRKLIPKVSPGKTVVGGVAGLTMSVAMAVLLSATILSLHPLRGTSALLGAGMGVVLGVAAQVGDLAESVMKREAGDRPRAISSAPRLA